MMTFNVKKISKLLGRDILVLFLSKRYNHQVQFKYDIQKDTISFYWNPQRFFSLLGKDLFQYQHTYLSKIQKMQRLDLRQQILQQRQNPYFCTLFLNLLTNIKIDFGTSNITDHQQLTFLLKYDDLTLEAGMIIEQTFAWPCFLQEKNVLIDGESQKLSILKCFGLPEMIDNQIFSESSHKYPSIWLDFLVCRYNSQQKLYNLYTFFTIVTSSVIDSRFQAAKKILANIESHLNVNLIHVLIVADSVKAKSIVPKIVADNRKIVCVPFDEISLTLTSKQGRDNLKMFWKIQDLNKMVQELQT